MWCVGYCVLWNGILCTRSCDKRTWPCVCYFFQSFMYDYHSCIGFHCLGWTNTFGKVYNVWSIIICIYTPSIFNLDDQIICPCLCRLLFCSNSFDLYSSQRHVENVSKMYDMCQTFIQHRHTWLHLILPFFSYYYRVYIDDIHFMPLFHKS